MLLNHSVNAKISPIFVGGWGPWNLQDAQFSGNKQMNFVTITITTSGNCKQFNLLHKLNVVREQAIINWVECIPYRDRGQGRGVRYSWGVLVASSTTSGTAVEYAKHVEWNREATDSEFHSLIEVFDVRRAERLKCGCLDCIPPPYTYIYIYQFNKLSTTKQQGRPESFSTSAAIRIYMKSMFPQGFSSKRALRWLQKTHGPCMLYVDPSISPNLVQTCYNELKLMHKYLWHLSRIGGDMKMERQGVLPSIIPIEIRFIDSIIVIFPISFYC